MGLQDVKNGGGPFGAGAGLHRNAGGMGGSHGDYADVDGDFSTSTHDIDAHGASSGTSAPLHNFSQPQRPYNVHRPMQASQFGYTAPSEQTTYGGGADYHTYAD